MSTKVTIIPVTPLRQNCTLMWCSKTLKGVVIDPGGDIDVIQDAISEAGMSVEKILLTHGHFDHVGGAMDLQDATGAPIIGPHKDDAYLTAAVVATGQHFEILGGRDVIGNSWLEDGDTVTFGTVILSVLHTPGHTPGHIIFYDADTQLAQVGDVLFKGSIGRSDFPRGDLKTLVASITQKLWPLGGDVTFIPGHGPTSTFAHERATNPHVSDAVLA